MYNLQLFVVKNATQPVDTALNLESASADWDGRVELVANVKFFQVAFMATAKNR